MAMGKLLILLLVFVLSPFNRAKTPEPVLHSASPPVNLTSDPIKSAPPVPEEAAVNEPDKVHQFGEAVDPWRSMAPPQCTPFHPPSPHEGLQDYCRFLGGESTRVFDRMFRNAPPASRAEGLGLKGCVVGCLVGNGLQNVVGNLPWNAGAWSGKCFNWFDSANPYVPTQVINIISPNKDLVAWSGGLGGMLAYPGAVRLDRSRVDRKPVWVIDYANTPTFFGRDLSGFFDEMREVAPGFILGEVWIRPFTLPYNPGPLNWPALKFALFQTCTAERQYAFRPQDRVIAG